MRLYLMRLFVGEACPEMVFQPVYLRIFRSGRGALACLGNGLLLVDLRRRADRSTAKRGGDSLFQRVYGHASERMKDDSAKRMQAYIDGIRQA